MKICWPEEPRHRKSHSIKSTTAKGGHCANPEPWDMTEHKTNSQTSENLPGSVGTMRRAGTVTTDWSFPLSGAVSANWRAFWAWLSRFQRRSLPKPLSYTSRSCPELVPSQACFSPPQSLASEVRELLRVAQLWMRDDWQVLKLTPHKMLLSISSYLALTMHQGNSNLPPPMDWKTEVRLRGLSSLPKTHHLE